MRVRTTAAAVLGFGLLLTAPFAEAAREADKPLVRLGTLPKIDLAPRPATTDEQAKHIKQLIASLANLDRSQFGLAGIGSGSAFAPMLTRREVEKQIMDDRVINAFPAFKELVALGPDSLPFLLDATDDKTPTKVVYRHEPDENGFEYGVMSYGREFSSNPVNSGETQGGNVFGGDDEHIHVYTLKVGDICFLAIGQIVGRSYHPARYQSTRCIVINSPTHDPTLCADIRKSWAATDCRRRLFDSLRTDYATETVEHLDDGFPDPSEQFQCSAATRLLYYFPRESAALIVARLDALDVSAANAAGKSDSVRPVEFVKAVAWSTDPAVRAAVARVFARTDDPDVVLASAPAVDDKAVLTPRLLWAAGTVPADLSRIPALNRANWVIDTLISRIPESAEPPLRAFVKEGDTYRFYLVCRALAGSKMSWDTDLLGSWLTDQRNEGFCAVDGKDGPNLRERVCDCAAVTLAANHPELPFKLIGTHDDLDRQITAMRATLAAKANGPATRP